MKAHKLILSIILLLTVTIVKGQIQEYVIEASDSLITRGVLQIDADKFKATTQVSSDDTTLVSLDYLTGLLDNAEYADSLAFHSGTGYLVYYREGVALDSTSFDGRYQTTLTNPVTGTGTANYIPKWTGLSTLGNSLIYDNGTNLGINTALPTQKLHVKGTSSASVGLFEAASNGYANIDLVSNRTSGNLGGVRYVKSGETYSRAEINYHLDGRIDFNTGDGSTTFPSIKMSILDSGNVGIGTTTPAQKLDVNGNIRVRGVGTNTTSTVLGLDSNGDLTTNVTITGGATWKGGWNASTNTPTLSDATGTNGWWYKVTVAGTQNLGSGSITFAVGDDVIHNGTVWQKFSSSITEADPVFVASDVYEWTEQDSIEWSTAYSWGDHATAGYLTAEVDPVFSASGAYGITSGDKTNWNTAYNDKINSAAFSGTTTKTLSLTQQDGGTVTANFTDNNTTYSQSAETVTGGAEIRLSGSDATTDDVAIKGAGTVTVARTDASTITITGAANNDNSSTNEGVLGVSAGTATTSVITSNTSGATGVTLVAGTGMSIAETTSTNGGTITLTNNAPDQTVSLTGSGATSVSGTYPNFTISSTDNNTTYTGSAGVQLVGNDFRMNIGSLNAGAISASTHYIPWYQTTGAHWRTTLAELQAVAGYNAGKIQNVTVSSTAPTTDYVLKYNGTTWAPAPDATGAGALTSGDAINVTGDSINYKPTRITATMTDLNMLNNAASIVTNFEYGGAIYRTTLGQLSDLGLYNARELRGYTIASSTPSTGEVLKWTGSQWEPEPDATGGMTDPMTTRGDIIYRNSSNVTARLGRGTAGQLLYSNGTDISWRTPVKADVGLGNVENTAVSTWTGSVNLQTLGSVTSGTWSATPIAATHGGTGKTSYTAYALLAGGSTSTGTLQQVAGVGTSGQVLTSNGAGALPSWQAAPSGTASLTNTYVGVGNASNVLSGTSNLTFSGSVLSVYGGTGIVKKSVDQFSTIASITTPAASNVYMYAKTDDIPYYKDDTGLERPLTGNFDEEFAASISSPGGTTLVPATGMGNGMYMYEVTVSIMNQAGSIINTYIYHLSFRFAAGSIAYQRLTEVYKNESNANVSLNSVAPIEVVDLGSTCKINVNPVWTSGSYSNVNLSADAKRIAYKAE